MTGTTVSDVCYLQGPRSEQEDRFRIFHSNGRCYVVVADGMGGYAGGAIAADAAVSAAERYLLIESGDVEDLLRGAVETADRAVRTKAAQADFGDMGTTLLVACISDDRVSIVNVGDSRAYLIVEDRVIRCTRDHTVASERPPGYSGGDAQHLTQALGHGDYVDPDYFDYPFPAGSRIALCTDGVYKSDEQQFLRAVGAPITPTEAVSLLKENLAAGHLVDNATAVVVDRGTFRGCRNLLRVELPPVTSSRFGVPEYQGRKVGGRLLGWLLAGLALGVVGVVGIQRLSSPSVPEKPFADPGQIINPNDEVFAFRGGKWHNVAPARLEVGPSERVPLVVGNAFGRVPVLLSLNRGKVIVTPVPVQLSLRGLREQVNGEIIGVEFADLDVRALDGYRVWNGQAFCVRVRRGKSEQIWAFVINDGKPAVRGQPVPVESPTSSTSQPPRRRRTDGGESPSVRWQNEPIRALQSGRL